MSRAHTRGFTLVELLVSLAILALALGLVLPRLSGTSITELKGAARVVAAGLRSARETSISSNRNVALRVDVEARTMVLVGTAREAAPKRLAQDLEYKLFTARSELYGENGGQIRFFPDGSSTGGRVTISSGTNSIVVDVDWLTGRIVLLDQADAGDTRIGARIEVLRSPQLLAKTLPKSRACWVELWTALG